MLQITDIRSNTDEAEQSVLGAILLDEQALAPAVEILTEEDFLSVKHKAIWGAMIRLSDRGEPIDMVTMTRDLELAGQLEKAGGAAYLAELINVVPSAANIGTHCKLVREHRQYRELEALGRDVAYQASLRNATTQDLLDLIEQRVFGIAHGQTVKGFVKLADVLKSSLAQIQERAARGTAITGVPTGFATLDNLTAGWQPSDLIVIAARPGMGKTALAMQCAVAGAKATGKPAVVFSLEMSQEQLATRLLCEEATINSHRVKTGRLTREDWWRLAKTAGEMEGVNLWINDSPAMTFSRLRSAARRFANQHGLSLLVLDYLQLLPSPPGFENRQQGIAEISRGLKMLAKELNVPILALSQLNRQVEGRMDRRPMLADLRESGAIEQDADLILFLYRDEVYDPDSEDKGTAEVLIRKHRNGPVGDSRLAFMADYAKFGDLAL